MILTEENKKKDPKLLVVFNKLNKDKLNMKFHEFTMRDFIRHLENENLKEGILKIAFMEDKMVVAYK